MGDYDGNDMEDTSGYEKSSVHRARLGSEDLITMILPTGL